MSIVYQPPPSCQIPGLAQIYEEVFGLRATGSFVEVGAFDGESYSNTSFLADLGWKGVYVEPIGEYAQRCLERHACNAVAVMNFAVGDEHGEVILEVAGALTTGNADTLAAHWANPGSKAYMLEHKQSPSRRPLYTLDGVLRLSELSTPAIRIRPGFDLLVVDVEGMEPDVFAGFSLEVWRPRMMIVELHQDNAEFAATAAASNELRRKILATGYRELYVDQINTIFVRSQ